MPTTWQNFLLEQGGQLDEHDQIQFGDVQRTIAKAQNNNTLASLDHYGMIYASGDDAKSFIQAQFSNDIDLLDEWHVQFSAYCNPKGRMLAQFLVIPFSEGYLLLLARETLDKTLTRLRMFVLRSAVTLEDVTEQLVCFGLLGNSLSSALPATWPDLPQDDYSLIHYEQDLIVKIPGPYPRYLVIATMASATAIWKELSSNFHISGTSIWHWADIQAGLPSVWLQTVEEFVPQMMNLELIGGVSFKKGCYPGQEIVARMHYLGKAKRRMFRLHSQDENLPEPGTDIFIANGDGQSAGKVVIAEPGSSGGTDILAVLQLSYIKDSDLRLGGVAGAQLKLQDLPYTIESEI